MQPQHSSRELRSRLRLVAAAAMATAVMVLAAPVRAEPTQTAADVAAEIVAVQIQADAVAQQWTSLDAATSELDERIALTAQAVDAATATLDVMETTLSTIAVNRYTGAQRSTVFALEATLMTGVQTTALTGFALGTGEFDLDAYRLAQHDLTTRRSELDALRQRSTDARTTLQQRQQVIDGYLVRLESLHANLQDAEVKRAYETQLADRRRQDEAAAAAAAAEKAPASAAADSAPARGAGAADVVSAAVAAPTTPPAATAAPDTTAATPSPTVAGPNTAPPSTAPVAVATTEPPTSTPAPAPAAAPATVAPTTAPPTPATVAPTTAPPSPPTAPAPAAVGGLVCPLAGPSAFGDTWGAARENGKRHEGVDMISRFGTPIVAVADGYAQFKTNRLGGNAIGLKATSGDYFYYAHLSSWEGSSRNVRAGDVIGYVGHTGITSVDHLHWEIHPGGGAAINPYPTARRIC